MIIGEWALILNILSIATIGLVITHVIQFLLWPLLAKRLSTIKPSHRKYLLWGWGGSPLLLTVTIASLFVSAKDSPDTWLYEVAHWHHSYVFHLQSWHGVFLLVFVGAFLWLFTKSVSSWVRQQSNLSDLELLGATSSTIENSKLNYQLIASPKPAAFTAGFLSPKCYITQGLHKKLTHQELSIVVKHEHSHINNRDPLTKQLFALLTILYPKQLRDSINSLYQLTLEEIADQQVLEDYSSVDIASSIISVVKSQRHYHKDNVFCYFGNDHISIRVNELISPKNINRLPVFATMVLFLTLFIATVSLIDTSHHLIESLFTH